MMLTQVTADKAAPHTHRILKKILLPKKKAKKNAKKKGLPVPILYGCSVRDLDFLGVGAGAKGGAKGSPGMRACPNVTGHCGARGDGVPDS